MSDSVTALIHGRSVAPGRTRGGLIYLLEMAGDSVRDCWASYGTPSQA